MTPSFKVNENKKESDKNMNMFTVLCNKLNPLKHLSVLLMMILCMTGILF